MQRLSYHVFVPVGYYLYMSSSRVQPKDTARVSYTFTSVSQSYCQMNFYYHMYGAGMGVLRLFVEPQNGQRTEVPYSTFYTGLHICGRRGGLVVNALDSGSRGPGSSPGRVIVLCSWARLFTLTMPLSTHGNKWEPVNCQGNMTDETMEGYLRWTSIPSRGE